MTKSTLLSLQFESRWENAEVIFLRSNDRRFPHGPEPELASRP
jgi:hypothetical protein